MPAVLAETTEVAHMLPLEAARPRVRAVTAVLQVRAGSELAAQVAADFMEAQP
jgi:hypothetical protein